MNFIHIPYSNGHFFLSPSREDFPFLKVYGRLNFLFPFESSQNEWIKSFLKHSFSKPSWKSWGFPGGSDGKKSACNARDPGLIPALGRSPGEGNGNPLQYFCLKNSMDRAAWSGYSPWGCKELDTTKWVTLHWKSWVIKKFQMNRVSKMK